MIKQKPNKAYQKGLNDSVKAGWAQEAIVCLAGEEKPEPGHLRYGINKDPGK